MLYELEKGCCDQQKLNQRLIEMLTKNEFNGDEDKTFFLNEHLQIIRPHLKKCYKQFCKMLGEWKTQISVKTVFKSSKYIDKNHITKKL